MPQNALARDKFAAQYVTSSGGAVAMKKKVLQFSPTEGGHFCTLLGWNAMDLYRLAVAKIKKDKTNQTPKRHSADRQAKNTKDYQKAAKEHMATLLMSFAVQRVEVLPEEEEEDLSDGEEKDDGLSYVTGNDLTCTVHQFDMYSENPNEKDWDKEEQEEWPHVNLFMPNLLQRLQRTFGDASAKAGAGESETRMVMITSPPFGWGMSEGDKPPNSGEEWKVFPKVHTLPPHTSTHIQTRLLL